MSTYPLPGETVTRTMTGVEFGTARPRDEPAPPEIAKLFRSMQDAFEQMGVEYQCWQADRSPEAFTDYSAARFAYAHAENKLRIALRSHRDRCYTCDGHRFWLHVESHGCRRNVIKMEPLQ